MKAKPKSRPDGSSGAKRKKGKQKSGGRPVAMPSIPDGFRVLTGRPSIADLSKNALWYTLRTFVETALPIEAERAEETDTAETLYWTLVYAAEVAKALVVIDLDKA